METTVRFLYLDHDRNMIAYDDYEDCEADIHAHWCDMNGIYLRRVTLNQHLVETSGRVTL